MADIQNPQINQGQPSTQETQSPLSSVKVPMSSSPQADTSTSSSNDATSTQTQQSEFATKGALIEKSQIKKIALIATIGVLGLAILVVAIIIISQIVKPGQTLQDTPTIQTDPVVEEKPKDKPNMAYIKNSKSIWVATTDGQEKNQVLEIPATAEEYFTDVEWKTKDILTYSKCTKTRSCSIESYNIKDKSAIVEVSQANRTGEITRIKWDSSAKYLAFLRKNGEDFTINFKAGTVTQTFNTLLAQVSDNDIESKISFDTQSQYIAIYLTQKIVDEKERNAPPIYIPTIYVYQPNGVLIDQITNAKDPEFDRDNNLFFISNGQIIQKQVGDPSQTIVTNLAGRNISISADANLIAYWDDQGGFANARLNVYDLKQNIHRNILRGIILPKWISANQVVGIKPESCIGTSCQLYEFQTTSLFIINVQDTSATDSVIQLDQGKTLSSVKYNYHADQR